MIIYSEQNLYTVVERPNKLIGFDFAFKGTESKEIVKLYVEETRKTLLEITKKVYNGEYFVRDKHIKTLEKLAETYKFDDLIAWFERYWENLNNVAIMNDFVLEERTRPEVLEKNRIKIREFKEEMKLDDTYPELKLAKISYLEGQNTNLSSSLVAIDKDIHDMEAKDEDSSWMDMVREYRGYNKAKGKLLSNRITISHLKDTTDSKKIVVTDDMIAMAKNVPFSQIMKLENIGGRMKARCPFHRENTPSFIIYPDTNRGHCHGCGRNVDTIQYLVEIKKIKFNEAVLMLLQY